VKRDKSDASPTFSPAIFIVCLHLLTPMTLRLIEYDSKIFSV